MQRKKEAIERIVFLDQVRLFAVLAVVALHAGIAYAPLVPWWYVADPDKSAALDLVLILTDGFVMPVLFCIAGYFAVPSLRRRKTVGFLVAKLRRLGLPLLTLTIFFCPIISYIVLRNQGGSESYVHYWLRVLPTALDWRFHLLLPEDLPELPNHLWSFHLWFLGVLLLFFVLLALGAVVVGRRAESADREKAGAGPCWLLLVGVAGAGALGQVAVPDSLWVSVGTFFEIQPARFPLYLGMFLLGAYAWDRKRFGAHPLPGRLWVWGGSVIAAYLCMVACGAVNMAPGPKVVWVPLAYGLCRAAVALSVTGLLIVVGQRYWNRPGRVGAGLAAASYDIYLLHMPLVVVLQQWLVPAQVSPLVKFVVIFFTATAVCWGASRLVSWKRRWLAPGGVMAIFAITLLVCR